MESQKGKKKICILYVSGSDTGDARRVSAYLKRKGATVFKTSSPSEAYRLLKDNPVHVVLSEYNVPKTSGLNFLKKLKSIKHYVEVIFMSDKVTLPKAIEAMKAGAYDFYESPVNTKLLLTVIEKAVEKELLHVDKLNLEKKVKDQFDPGKIVGRSRAMKTVLDTVRSISHKNVNTLLTGETGSGKEMIANLIHHNSPRASEPFIKMNCAAFSKGVLESELFGHEKGAFTGALTKRIGRFELADKGTIFLDEIGDMPLGTQIKLLRVLQEKEFERVGGNETIKVNVRIIAATNQNLNTLIQQKKFREDLYYRINVVHIHLPPLRERKDDIPTLASTFIYNMNEEKGYGINRITREAMQMLINYKWPGNVRELENTVESAMALAEKDMIEPKYLPSFLLFSQTQEGDFYQVPQNLTLSEIEREIIKVALERTKGNKTKASKMLGIGLRTLQRKAKDL